MLFSCYNFLIRLRTILYFDELIMICINIIHKHKHTLSWVTLVQVYCYLFQYLNIVRIKTKLRKHLSDILYNL